LESRNTRGPNTFLDRVRTAVILLSLLASIIGCAGCGGQASAQQPTRTAIATASAASVSENKAPKTTTPPATKSSAQANTRTSPTATQKTVPKLTDISFTLALDPGQTYTEHTTPIYLLPDQKLHLSWLVVKGGDYFYLSFSLPTAKVITIRSDGSLGNYSPETIKDEKLTKSGDVIIYPACNDWIEGYYIFHPQLFKGDPPVTVRLLYWIE
jgi:hypothetical protein